MRLEFPSVVDHGLVPVADVMARAFADYFVKIVATRAVLLQMARGDSVDLSLSRVAMVDGVAVGAALIARRGWTSRLAGMALVPEGRRRGVGRALVQQLLDDARGRGDRAMVLEVIEQNTAAVKLYEACGFARVRRLVGYAGSATLDSAAAGGLREVDVRDVGAAVMQHGRADLPWQISGETIAQAGPPVVGYGLDGAWIALGNIASSPVTIRTLVAESGKAEKASRLLRAVMAKYPGKEWRISALWPEEDAGVFEAVAGLKRIDLAQWQMMRMI